MLLLTAREDDTWLDRFTGGTNSDLRRLMPVRRSAGADVCSPATSAGPGGTKTGQSGAILSRR
jgi:hypothetical protein